MTEVLIYPNPTNGEVHVQFAKPYSGGLEVFNYMGQRIMARQLNKATNFNFQIDGANGFYIYQFTNKVQSFSGTIVLQR